MPSWNKIENQKQQSKLLESLRIFFLIATAGFIIFYQFNQIPKNLAFDEVEFAKLALSLNNKPYIPYSPEATGHPTLYFYIILLSFKIFGINNFALRFPAAFFGILNILIFYLILKKIFNKSSYFLISHFFNFPFILSFVFLTSRWYFNFARFAFEATFLLFLELVSIFFFLKYIQVTLREQDESRDLFKINSYLFFSGLFAGLAFNSYTPGRIFFFLPLTILIVKIIKPLSNQTIKQLLLFLIPFIITAAPLSIYLLKHPDIRFNQQFFWKNSQLTFPQKINYSWENIKSTILMFHFKGDLNGRHNYPGKPALNPVLGLLFITGFFISLKTYKNFYSLLFIIYFFLSLFPTLMTYPWENPNMLRVFTAIPSIIYFIGISLSILLKLFKRSWRGVSLILLFLIFFSSIYEIRTYFKYQAKVFKNSFEIKYPLEKAIKMKNLYEK